MLLCHYTQLLYHVLADMLLGIGACCSSNCFLSRNAGHVNLHTSLRVGTQCESEAYELDDDDEDDDDGDEYELNQVLPSTAS